MSNHGHDPLAYGNGPHDSSRGDSARGLVGDTFKFLRDSYKSHQTPPSHQGHSQPYSGSAADYYGTSGPSAPFHGSTSSRPDKLGGFLDKIEGTVANLGSEFVGRLGTAVDPQAYTEYGQQRPRADNRFGSFAPPRPDNDVKWYVDGCNYFYAVSCALESARETVWILDWWLSPELYLRRPPSQNEQYRLDRMLQAAAQRGVRINVIVYKEVPEALSLCSVHTKHALEALHPNIAVFRHPDHVPDSQDVTSSFTDAFKNLSLDGLTLSKLSGDTLKALYGIDDNTILYWAHHEKLCLIDGRIAFMGGLDMCFGRWDTHQHAIADVHPTNPNETVFPGQDYNNARVLDFQDVAHWQENKLDRKTTSRMGWSDISVSLHGEVVEDLRRHFVERWNFIYDTKYAVRKEARYGRLALYGRPGHQSGSQPHHYPGAPQRDHVPSSRPQYSSASHSGGHAPSSHTPQYTYSGQSFPPPPPYSQQGSHPPPHDHRDASYPPPPSPYGLHDTSYHPPPGPPSHSPHGQTTPYFPPPPTYRGMDAETREGEDRGLGRQRLRDEFSEYGNVLRGHLAGQIHQYQDRLTSYARPNSPRGKMNCQMLRSCTKWSNGSPTEHSVVDAYAAVIRNSEHFVYIENQFFITATGDKQDPVKNRIGAAIVERILRAARAGAKYKIIVVIPAVPGFAGDLAADSSLGTRAIMEFQYNSINRGGHSIMEMIAREGYNPMEYIRFYNLRNYDRINFSGSQGGGQDFHVRPAFDTTAPWQQPYQRPQGHPSGRWDSVSECYMLDGEDIRRVPWEGTDEAEINAFVSEELYIHSKVLIADDRVVICGSANLNDRSQLGTHDSEIAVLIEDHTPVPSRMNGRLWTASRFAASLRRELFRKHLGLLPPQDYKRANANSEPVGIPNQVDFDSPESRVVADPLSETFDSLWNSRAKTNTAIFRRVFHAVPDDSVRDWASYKEFFGYYFHNVGKRAYEKGGDEPTRYKWGHVVRDEFPAGPDGVRQVKELLSQVQGTLVEMPLMFLIEEDIAEEGVMLNELTEPIYT